MSGLIDDASDARSVASARRARRASTALVVVISMLLGAAVAGGFGWHEVTTVTNERLGAYATQLVEQGNAFTQEAADVFDRLARSPDAFCSDAELARMRDVAFHARYLKDVGRLRDGALQCSAALGRIDTPQAASKADLVTARGWSVIRSAPILMSTSGRAPVLASGATNVVLGNHVFHDLDLPALRYTIVFVDAAGARSVPLFGAEFPLEAADLARSAAFERDGTLYHALCSMNHEFCAVTAADKSAVRAAFAEMLVAYLLLGALAAAGLAMSVLLLLRQRLSIEARLRRAIRDDLLYVEYQPIVRLSDLRIVGAEALARWNDSDGRAVAPVRFIALAEQQGCVGAISELVLRHTLRDFGDLLRSRGDFQVNINISARDIAQPAFAAELEKQLRSAGVARERIAFELTEHASAERTGGVAATRHWRELGHRIYIDDFGTGYSSLAYLHELDVAAIKLDRSFTHAIGTEAVTSSVVPQIIEMARRLHLDVVIEGIETETQAAYFHAVDYPLLGQGWLFGRPQSAEALRARLVSDRG